MQVKISKTLEGLIARTAFQTTKAGITHSLKDFLALELLREEGSLACQILYARLQTREVEQVRLKIERALTALPISAQQLDTRIADPAYAERFFRSFAEELRQTYASTRSISTGHALAYIVSDPASVTAQVLATLGIMAEDIAEALQQFAIGDDFRTDIRVHLLDFDADNHPERQTPHLLEKFGVDLTRLAREGKLDPVVGREAEIERVVQILSRRKKNNPVLIGEAGVGKSAVVEGLALRIATGKVPESIASKRIFSLDISSLVAGTKFRGEFEERMQQLLDELRKAQNTILFIDEIHTIVGAGSTQGSLDTANILKPALARGELQTIGATTLDEYRENIERDSALERRFQKVLIEPTTSEQTLQILRRLAPHYEQHHRVHYTEEALQACVALADRYISDRQFPDKAIDVMDEAGSRAHLLETDEIAEEHIRQVITSMTGVPTERISENEMSRLHSLREYLSARVVGQQAAVDRLSRTICRSRAGLKEEHRPMGVFLFVGPTGVGKTLLAKEISKWLFDDRRGLIRIDMSEYSEKHNVARLIGSPPGYVGYGEGGQLTEAVRRQPYAVVLFDEIEKAHPDIFNTLLQLFDEGRLTDGSGRTVDFRNTIIIMTSNVGSRSVAQRPALVGFSTISKRALHELTPQTEYRKVLEETFAPEFLNRIDDIIQFRSLELEDVERIVELELQGLLARTNRLGYVLTVTAAAKRRLATMGYESRYGVRSLKRTLTEQIEEPLSDLIVAGHLHVGDRVVIDAELEGVQLRVA